MNENIVKYDTDHILKILENQFTDLINNSDNKVVYSNYKIILSNEQMYIRPEERNDVNAIYIVVKFMEAQIMFGQNMVPITINAVSEYNKIDVSQQLLLEYAQTYNLKSSELSLTDSNETNNYLSYNQTYTTPVVSDVFSEVFYGYRDLFFMTGTFLISYNSSPIEYIKYKNSKNEWVNVDFLNSSISFDTTPDTQPYAYRNNFTNSVNKFATFTLNFTSYLVDEDLYNDALDMMMQEDLTDDEINEFRILETNEIPRYVDINKYFLFEIKFKRRKVIYRKKLKLVNGGIAQSAGELPTISFSFTN